MRKGMMPIHALLWPRTEYMNAYKYTLETYCNESVQDFAACFWIHLEFLAKAKKNF